MGELCTETESQRKTPCLQVCTIPTQIASSDGSCLCWPQTEPRQGSVLSNGWSLGLGRLHKQCQRGLLCPNHHVPFTRTLLEVWRREQHEDLADTYLGEELQGTTASG